MQDHVFISLDYDECTAGTHSCTQVCTNTMGSYNCDCHHGVTKDSKGVCIDSKSI